MMDLNCDLAFSGFYMNLMLEYSQRIQVSRMTIDRRWSIWIVILHFLGFILILCWNIHNASKSVEWRSIDDDEYLMYSYNFLSFASLSRQIAHLSLHGQRVVELLAKLCQELKGCVRPISLPSEFPCLFSERFLWIPKFRQSKITGMKTDSLKKFISVFVWVRWKFERLCFFFVCSRETYMNF